MHELVIYTANYNIVNNSYMHASQSLQIIAICLIQSYHIAILSIPMIALTILIEIEDDIKVQW